MVMAEPGLKKLRSTTTGLRSAQTDLVCAEGQHWQRVQVAFQEAGVSLLWHTHKGGAPFQTQRRDGSRDAGSRLRWEATWLSWCALRMGASATSPGLINRLDA